jgi:hypothetical protein
METLPVPLFPLNTVLYPGGPLPLRIFEPRYLDMVADCVKNDLPFGVCLIENGKEAGETAVPHSIGTLARIIDWDKLPDGMLGIVVLGSDRFRIESTKIESNQLIRGSVTLLPEPDSEALPAELEILPRVLEQIIAEAGPLYEALDTNYADANWIGYRLAEILPLELPVRQHLLEQDDSLARLREIHSSIEVFMEKNA